MPGSAGTSTIQIWEGCSFWYVAAAVGAIDGFQYDADIGFRIIGAVLGDVGRRRGRGEGDGLSIGRPGGRGGSPGQVGQGARFTAFEREQVDLGAGTSALTCAGCGGFGPHEGDHFAVRGPLRARVVDAGSELPGLAVAGGGNDPEGRLVTIVLRIGGYIRVDDFGSVRRDLGRRGPVEMVDVVGGDEAFFSSRGLAEGGEGEESEDGEDREAAQVAHSASIVRLGPIQ